MTFSPDTVCKNDKRAKKKKKKDRHHLQTHICREGDERDMTRTKTIKTCDQ